MAVGYKDTAFKTKTNSMPLTFDPNIKMLSKDNNYITICKPEGVNQRAFGYSKPYRYRKEKNHSNKTDIWTMNKM